MSKCLGVLIEERMKKQIKIITNSGYKYSGEFVREDDKFIVIIDMKEGEIEIPISNISYVKTIKKEGENERQNGRTDP